MIRDYPRLALVPGGLRVAGNPGAPRGPETYVSEDGRFTVELSHGSTYPGNGHDLMGMWVGAGSLPKRLPSFINCVAEFKDDDGCWHRTFDDGAGRVLCLGLDVSISVYHFLISMGSGQAPGISGGRTTWSSSSGATRSS